MYAGEAAKAMSSGDFQMATGEEQAERLAGAAEGGFKAAIGLGLPGTVISTSREIARRNDQPDPVSVQQWAVNAANTVRGSKLFARSPEKFRQYMANVTGEDRLFMDAEAAETFYQSLTPEQQAGLQEAIPDLAGNIEEARLSGADLELAKADYFSYLVPLDLENRMADYIKMAPEHYSVGQIRDSMEVAQELLDGVEADFDAYQAEMSQAEGIERQYYDQLLNAGQTPDAARLNALRMRKAYETFTSRYGKNEQAAELIQNMLGQLSVERRFADIKSRMPVNDMDLFIDRVRNFQTRVSNKLAGAEKRRQTAIRKAQEKAEATGQPFKMPRMARSRKSLDPKNYPMLDFIARRGGVDPDSMIAGELKAIGVDKKNAPWLFTKGRAASMGFFGKDQGERGGFTALDTIGMDDFRQYFDVEPVGAPTSSTDDSPFYVSEQFILDQVREEMFGNPIIGREQNTEEALFDDFLRFLDQLGVDFDTATNDEIKRALAEAQGVIEGDDTLYQSAYHGSPYRFDKFTTDHIGSGEGAQAYGWGLYFAGRREVAEWYRQQLAPVKKKGLFGKSDFDPSSLKTDQARLLLRHYGRDFADLKDRIENIVQAVKNKEGQFSDWDNSEVAAYTKDLQDDARTISKLEADQGQLYQVQIPEDDVMLHWDKPLTEQPGKVQEALSRFGIKADKKAISDYDDALLSALTEDGSADLPNQPRNPTGEDIYNMIARNHMRPEPAPSWTSVSVDTESSNWSGHKGASLALNESGILGIKYLDGSSRGKGDGSFNYVIFDDASIQVLETFYQDGDRGSGPRGQIEFLDDMSARITLWERANLSTLIHEEGHLYWRLLSRIAEIPEAMEAFPNAVKDAETVRAWVKAKPGQKLTVAQEEQIARGFEAWIMGGKAPSLELQSAFQRFAAWMMAIYKDLKNLAVSVPDDVAQVFERLLATDEEIDALANNREFRMSEEIMAMLTKAEKERYERQYERAVGEAKDKLFNNAIKEVTRQNRKFYKEERDKLVEESNALLDRSALYRAVEFLQKGIFRNPEGQVMEGVEAMKLDRKAVVERMGKEVLEYLPAGILSNKGGQNPDVFAEMFGYDSGEAMLRPMMNFVPRKIRVEQMADEEMKARYGDMLNDGSIEREAVEAFHNDYRQYLLELEVKTLAKAANMPVPLGVSFKIKAEEIIGKKQVKDLIPYRYYRAAIKASREAGLAIGKGDYVAAAVAKQRQLLNHHLYMMANQRRDFIDKKFRKWKKITTRSDKDTAKSRDVDYIYAARSVLANYGIGRSNFNFKAWAENLLQDDPDTADMMSQTIQAATMTDASGRTITNYKDLTMDQFQALSDMVDNILTIAKERREVIVDGEKADLDETAAQIAGTIYANVPIRPDQDARESTMLGNSVEGLSNIATKMITWTEQIDGGRNGIFYKAVQKMVRQAEVTRAQRQREAALKLSALYEKFYGDVKIGNYTATFEQLASSPGRRFVSDVTGGRIDLTGKVYIPEINRSLSREEIIAAAFNYGNDDNAIKFMEGMAKDPKYNAEWTEEQYLAVLANMRDKDWDFVEQAAALINSFWPETVALDRRTKGYAAPKIQGRPFSIVTAEGNTRTFEGWYYPVKYSSDKSSRMSGKILEQDLKELAAGQRSYAATKQGRTKERMESSGEPVRTDLDVVAEAIEEAVTDITMREAVLNTRKIFGHKEVREAIDATLGPKVYAQFTMWLQDVASGPRLTDGAVGALMRGFRSSMSASAMGLKLSSALLQPTGVIQAIPEVGSSWMVKGFYRYMTAGRTGPWSAAEQVRELSPFMEVRVYNQNREASEAFRRAQNGGFINDAEGKLYWLMQKLQQIPDTIIWMSAYERATAPKSKGGEGLSEKAAVDYADLAVETTQGGGLQSSLSAVERGSASERVRQAEVVKSLTVLYSYMNAKYNTYRRIRNKYEQSDRGVLAKAHLAGDLFLIMTVETMIGAIILGRAPDFDDEDDPEMAAFMYGLTETFKTFLSTLPIIGQATSFIDGFGGGSATQRGIGEIVKSTKTLGQEFGAIMDDDEEFNAWKALRAVNTGGIYLSPIKWPAGQVNVMLRAAEKDANGEDVSPVDYLIYRPEN